jgi:hypothetical protein
MQAGGERSGEVESVEQSDAKENEVLNQDSSVRFLEFGLSQLV